MQTDIQRRLLREVRLALPALAPGLEAYWAESDPGKDAEIFFVRDGLRHAVYIQVGANFASVNVMRHAVADLGHGIRHGVFEALTQGAPRRSAWEKVGPDLAAALAAHPDEFEPARAPGTVLHHEFPALLAAALDAFSDLPGGPWHPLANEGGAGGSEDTLAFADPGGEIHPVGLRTHPNALAEILVDGEPQSLVGRDAGGTALAALLRRTLAETSAPPVP